MMIESRNDSVAVLMSVQLKTVACSEGSSVSLGLGLKYLA